MKRTRIGLGVVGVVVWFLASAGSGAAQAPDEQAPDEPPRSGQTGADPALPEMSEDELDDAAARQHFVAARGLYDIGRFEDAAREFQEAYRLSRRAELLYNIYVAHRDAGHRGEATAALRDYLREMPDAPDRVNLAARLESLEAQLADEEQATAREAELQRQADQVEAERRARDAAAAGDDGVNLAPWIVAGAGGLVMIAGAVFGIVALAETSSLEEQCPDGLCPASYVGLEDDRSSARTFVTLSDWLLLGGGVVLAAGVVWGLLTLGGDSEDAGAPTASAACGPTGCMATVGAGF